MKKQPKKDFTESTYDTAARGYAKKYETIGARTIDVDSAFALLSMENPFVLEIGCGGGREAKYILTKTNMYVGMDISQGMLEIAKETVPEAQFIKADIGNYTFPEDVDIIFAFASLLHTDKENLKLIFERMHASLHEGGVVYVSLKRKDEYSQAVVEDEYGPRQFYYYTREVLHEVAGEKFKEVFYEEHERDEDWLTIILKKK